MSQDMIKDVSPEEIKQIRDEIDEAMEITPDNIMEKSIQIPQLCSKFLKHYVYQKRKLNNINTSKARLYSQLYHHYKYDYDYKLDTKKEIEIYVLGDEKHVKMQEDFDKQEDVVEYFKDILSVINKMSFNIGHYVELLKIKNGMGR